MATNSTNVVVDDTNPALVYNGTWVSGGVSSEYNVTTHGSTQKGASMRFTFRGTSVSVYGTIGTDTPTSSYTIDGSTPSVFAAGKYNTFVYQQLFFHSSTLTDAEHTLLVTNTGSGEFWIDYLAYTSSSPASSSSSSSLLPSTTLSLQSTLTSRTATPSQIPNAETPTPNPPATSGPPGQVSSNTKSSIPAPAVAGASIGALVLIIVLIFGLLYYRKRAKQLAGEKLSDKNDPFDPPAPEKAGPGAPITPFSVYTSSPHTPFGFGSSKTDVYLPGPAYPPLDHGYQNQSQPSTPIYHFSNPYSFGPGYNASSENIAGIGTSPGYGGTNPAGPQHGDTQFGYVISAGQPDYSQSPHSPPSGFEQHPYTSTDRLAVPERRNSLESAESHASLAYLSADRVAMNPSSPLPDAVPGPPPTEATPKLSEKGSFIVHNPEIRQHEDGGVRLDVAQPPGSQQQVVDVPPVYKPNY